MLTIEFIIMHINEFLCNKAVSGKIKIARTIRKGRHFNKIRIS
ncbi:hypothetical protein HMPREF0758_0825 [Serratia odorifera DSM 4582]|uniref:Uncharacterized protein n=1 Tax=Serratia odorifera DSM 4582 TaxID=667129 RepID=D4DY42_SEROD|nr:hypothetical protein HMPREF0758_0825 [Serratia odorifera DSM 4582]